MISHCEDCEAFCKSFCACDTSLCIFNRLRLDPLTISRCSSSVFLNALHAEIHLLFFHSDTFDTTCTGPSQSCLPL